jgi:coenzyme Q-binding protein COQ10
MPQFSTKRRVRQSAQDMFDLVADGEKYPEFLPLCSALHVKSRSAKPEGVTVMVADMTVDRPKLKILVEYLDGPFSRLQNRWTFHPIGEQTCDVEFFIDYEFKSRTLAMLMGAMFDTAFRKFALAFEQRADKIYGRKTG